MAVAIGIYQVFFGLSLKESPATGLEFIYKLTIGCQQTLYHYVFHGFEMNFLKQVWIQEVQVNI